MPPASYWQLKREIIHECELALTAYSELPPVPALKLCFSKTRDKQEQYKVHIDCKECSACSFDSEKVLQAYWRLQIIPFLKDHLKSAVLVDRHAHHSLPSAPFTTDPLSPDLVLYLAAMPHIDLYVLSLGDLKHSDTITADHCGQLAKYAQTLFDLHPHRHCLYAWLATKNIIRLFHFEANAARSICSIKTSYDYSYADGLPILCAMLRQNFEETCMFRGPIPLPASSDQLVPNRYLGRGTFATAYAAVKEPVDGSTYIVKLYRAQHAGALAHEQQMLQHLNLRNVKGVTKFICSAKYPPAAATPTVLVLQPEGITVERALRAKDPRFTRMCSLSLRPPRPAHCFPDAALCKLVDIIRDVHEIGGLVHCDLSLSNMYFVPDAVRFASLMHSYIPRCL